MRQKTALTLVNMAAKAVSDNTIKRRNLIWMELTGCAGNIISLLDGANPDFKDMITRVSNLVFENSIMASEGELAMEKLYSMKGKDYILAVEGAVSTKDNGVYNIIGRYKGRSVTAYEAIKEFGEDAAYVISVGTCASDGGISAASPNPGACVAIHQLLNRKVIKLMGCPCNPDWFMGTLSYITLFGEPELDEFNRPLMFYSTLIHDICPRRPYFEQRIFATKFGEKTCMFQLGCRGPVTRTDCPIRKWNERVNWPIGADANCIGCAAFGFPDKMSPFIQYED